MCVCVCVCARARARVCVSSRVPQIHFARSRDLVLILNPKALQL